MRGIAVASITPTAFGADIPLIVAWAGAAELISIVASKFAGMVMV